MREMIDSGVAWLGDIDSRFDIKAIGNLFTIKKDIIGREPDQVLSITQRGIKIKDTTSNEGQNAASYAHYQIVNVGDFAMNHMDLLTGWVDISQYEGVKPFQADNKAACERAEKQIRNLTQCSECRYE